MPIGQTLVSSLAFEITRHNLKKRSLFFTTNFLDAGVAQNPKTPNNFLFPFWSVHLHFSANVVSAHLLEVSEIQVDC